MGQDIHHADVARHFVRWDQPGKNKVFLQSKGARAVFQPLAPRPAAHEQEFCAGTLPDQVRRDVQQVVMPLQFE